VNAGRIGRNWTKLMDTGVGIILLTIVVTVSAMGITGCETARLVNPIRSKAPFVP
jgi:hypothetical protein